MVFLIQIKPPKFRKDSGIIKAIEQINRETEKNYTPLDFVDFKALGDIERNYSLLPLGLSDSERQNLLKTTIEGKQKDILVPKQEEFRKNLLDQQGSLPKPQTPIPNVPMPNVPPLTASVDPTTNLTRTETALLSPEEQVIAAKGRGGIMDLV